MNTDKSVQKYERMISGLPLGMRVAYEVGKPSLRGTSLYGVLNTYATAKTVLDFLDSVAKMTAAGVIIFVVIALSILFGFRVENAIIPVVLVSIFVTAAIMLVIGKVLFYKYEPIYATTSAILELFENEFRDLFYNQQRLVDYSKLSTPVLEMELVTAAGYVLRRESEYQYAKSGHNIPAKVMLMACQYEIESHERFEKLWSAAKSFGVTKRTKESIFDQAKGQITAKLPPKDWHKFSD